MADMHDTTTTTTCSSPLTNNRPVLETDEISLLLHHLLHSSSSSSATASSSASPSFSEKLKQMPFSSSSSSTAAPPFHHPHPLPPIFASSSSQFRPFSEDQHRQSCISTTTATPFPNSEFRVRDRTSTTETSAGLILSSSGVYFPSDEINDSSRLPSGVAGGSDSDALAVSDKRRKFPAENDLDDYDCESEEGMEASEEPSKQVPSRSSSKRSRAAEVHNLSEKRRRSRINEKMKALQNLIPNSNKTDKASMLDEAIEYLKQLQLQVQMLSMRNGLSLHPMYLPGVLQPLQLPQMQMGLREGTPQHLNVGTGALPLNQEGAARTSFGLSSQSANLHQPMAIQNLASLAHPNTAFSLDSSFPVHQTRYQLSSEEMYREGVLPPQGPHNLHISPMARNSSEGMTHIDARSSVLENTGHVETRLLQRSGSQNMLPEDVDSNQNLIQHLQSLQTGMNAGNDGKIKAREFQS